MYVREYGTMTGVTLILEFQHFSTTEKFVTSFWLSLLRLCTIVTVS